MGKRTKKEEAVPFIPQKELDELIVDIQKYSEKPNMKRVSAQTIVGVMGEFFESYIVFAHDLDGNQFVMRKADNARDMRAINGLVEDYVDDRITMTSRNGRNMGGVDNEIEDWMNGLAEDDDDDDPSDDDAPTGY